jgi:hypothetical protein
MACAAAQAQADAPAAALASLITPARNAGRWLGECAASVLAQTHVGPLEWIVFDDGSDDDTRAVLEAWRVRACPHSGSSSESIALTLSPLRVSTHSRRSRRAACACTSSARRRAAPRAAAASAATAPWRPPRRTARCWCSWTRTMSWRVLLGASAAWHVFFRLRKPS